MVNIYRKLLKEQRERGVVFSSELSQQTREDGSGGYRHEVTRQDFLDDPAEAEARVSRLKDASFFAGHYKYNIIREG